MIHANTAALLHHMMAAKRKHLLEAAVKAVSERHDEDVHMTAMRIYVGLNDSETKEQLLETERYLSILKDVCKRYRVAFSVDLEEGGYYHEDGEYTEENSLVLELIGTDKETAQRIARNLCSVFHQESVLVTETSVNGCFVVAEAS